MSGGRDRFIDWLVAAWLIVAVVVGVIWLATAIIGCVGTTYDEEPPPVGGNPTYATVRASVIIPKCAACHGPGPRDLTTYAGAMVYVVPYKPQESKLCTVLETAKMPPSGALPQEQVDYVCDWILAGSPES